MCVVWLWWQSIARRLPTPAAQGACVIEAWRRATATSRNKAVERQKVPRPAMM